jgi:hypothetical protein
MRVRSVSHGYPWRRRTNTNCSQAAPIDNQGGLSYRLFNGLKYMLLSETGVYAEGCRSIGATLSRDEFYATKRAPASAHPNPTCYLNEDWRRESRSRRFVELDLLLHHHSWRGGVLPG